MIFGASLIFSFGNKFTFLILEGGMNVLGLFTLKNPQKNENIFSQAKVS